MNELPDGSGFFIAEVADHPAEGDPIRWNPWNKVVQDCRDGTIDHERTNHERHLRGLPTPWTPAMADTECREPPVM